MELEEHLLRRESGRMVAALVRLFGLHNLPLAEDVAQDTLLRAVEVWKFRGLPENPTAWLMTAAKRRAIDVLRRERTARRFSPELSRFLESEWTLVPSVEGVFTTDALADGLLRMMLSCCHPRLSEEAKVGLILHLLCGFGTHEVAAAFLDSESAVEKRLQRAKATLGRSKRLLDTADVGAARQRLGSVQRALYLLFNEGYHGASSEGATRTELCLEARRLCALLLGHHSTAVPSSFALAALMALHAARLPGRYDAQGALTPLGAQDRARWDRDLVAEGLGLLDASASGTELTAFHLEAAIAAVHARAPSAEETDWREIVALYDRLAASHPSPVVELNRAIAIAELQGPSAGLAALEELRERSRQKLERYPFFPAARGEFLLRLARTTEATVQFEHACGLSRNAAERRHFERRLLACREAAALKKP